MLINWNTLSGFRRCDKCQGLWLGVGHPDGVCPEGGLHSLTDSNYSLVTNVDPPPPNHQGKWTYCFECAALYYEPSEESSRCPSGGHHTGSSYRTLALAANTGAGEQDWRFCNKCSGLSYAPNQAASTCPAGGQHNVNSWDYHLPIVTSRLNVHVKILVEPDISFPTLFQNMREAFATCNIDIKWQSYETLDIPALNVVDIGTCSGATTPEQQTLFKERNFAQPTDIVIYFVEATDPPANGCATYPPGSPGAIVVKTATQWTFAHEQGHLLGLSHVNDNHRLMTKNGTARIIPPPMVVAAECQTARNSPLLVRV